MQNFRYLYCINPIKSTSYTTSKNLSTFGNSLSSIMASELIHLSSQHCVYFVHTIRYLLLADSIECDWTFKGLRLNSVVIGLKLTNLIVFVSNLTHLNPPKWGNVYDLFIVCKSFWCDIINIYIFNRAKKYFLHKV